MEDRKRESVGESREVTCHIAVRVVAGAWPCREFCNGCPHKEDGKGLPIKLLREGGSCFILGVTPTDLNSGREEFCRLSVILNPNDERDLKALKALVDLARIREIADAKLRQKLGYPV